MDGSTLDNSIDRNESALGKKVITARGIIKIEAINIGESQRINLLNEKGELFAYLKRNKPGNNAYEVSYSFVYANGDEVLLPIPYHPQQKNVYVMNSPEILQNLSENAGKLLQTQVSVTIDGSGNIEISNLNDEGSLISEILEPEPLTLRYGSKVERRPVPEWQTAPLTPTQRMAVMEQNGNEIGSIYMVPNQPGQYIFRKSDGSMIFRIDGEEERMLFEENGKYVKVRVRNGQLELSGSGDMICDFNPMQAVKMPETGTSNLFPARINGGRRLFIASFKKVGVVKDQYLEVNEDSGGYNVTNGRVVISDGVGGATNGEHASHLAAKRILESKQNLNNATQDANYGLLLLDNFYKDIKSPTRYLRRRNSREIRWILWFWVIRGSL